MRVGVLHGGGPCPGANAAIEGAVQRADEDNVEVLGIPHGCKGLQKIQVFQTVRRILGKTQIHTLHFRAGCIIGTSRDSPARNQGTFDQQKWEVKKIQIRENLAQNRIHALLLIGGDDTLATTKIFVEEDIIHANHIPKTIDGDLTIPSFGLTTAASRAKQYVEEMRRGEAENYGRILVIESQGRHAGWLTREHQLEVLDGADHPESADGILLPEFEIPKDAIIAHAQQTLRTKGHGVLVVSEGFRINGEETFITDHVDDHGHRRLGHVSFKITAWLRSAGIDAAEQAPRHFYRSGPPTKEDADLAYAMGYAAMDSLVKGQYGIAPDATEFLASQGKNPIVLKSVHDIGGGNLVPAHLYDPKNLRRKDA